MKRVMSVITSNVKRLLLLFVLFSSFAFGQDKVSLSIPNSWEIVEATGSLDDLSTNILEKLNKKYGKENDYSIAVKTKYQKGNYSCTFPDSRVVKIDLDYDGKEDTAFWLKVNEKFILYLYETSSDKLIELSNHDGLEQDIPLLEKVQFSVLIGSEKEHPFLENTSYDEKILGLMPPCHNLEEGGYRVFYKNKFGDYIESWSGEC